MSTSHSWTGAYNPKGRLLFILTLIAITLAGFILHLFNLQIVHGQIYQTQAKQVARKLIPVPAQRGDIYDRNADVPLVINIPFFAVDIIPAEIASEEMETVIYRLATVLGLDPSKIEEKIPDYYRQLYQPIEIKSGVAFETITYIAEHIDQFPGVTWHNKPVRNYLESGSITHVIGYVGNITREELQVLYNRGYTIGATLGKAGIEKMYDMELRGTDGRSFRTVDVRGRRIGDTTVEDVPPTNGNNLVLTIDRDLQTLCEDALGDRTGSVILLRPHTGEILAMVSYPWYDPNIFYTDEASSEYAKLSLDPRFPFLNRAIQSSYPPASTFKLIMTTAILEEEAFPLDKTVECNGELVYGDKTFKCHKKNGHGRLNLEMGLAESCNVFFYTMGTEYLGIERISEYSRRLGLGELTGIDLPGEVKGLVPSPAWKDRTYHSGWVGGDTVNMSIGQGYLLVTPLQMANAVAMVVNEGVIYKPHVVKEIRDPVSGAVITEFEPELLHSTTIRADTFRTLKHYMRTVITDGTPKVVITTDAVKIAGKTGTGEVGLEDSWSSWFVAFAPYDAPIEEQIVLVVKIEGTNEWEWWAPRAANIIFQGIFADQNFEQAVDSLGWRWLVD